MSGTFVFLFRSSLKCYCAFESQSTTRPLLKTGVLSPDSATTEHGTGIINPHFKAWQGITRCSDPVEMNEPYKHTVKPFLSRRTMLKLGTVGLPGFAAGSVLLGNENIVSERETIQQIKLKGLLHNEDCTDFFFHQNIQPDKAGEAVDRYIDVLTGAGVSVLMCNTNARRTNYRSKVWEAFWDGYNPDGSDDQPFFANVKQENRKNYRKLIHNMLTLHNEGIDYPVRVAKRCRHHGISPWISLRMNDVHYNNNLEHPFHSELWRQPELFRQGDPGYYARALDYAHPQVRNHYRALIVETLERYDIDGLELDFLREPYLFSKGKEQQGRQILTEWMREIRVLVDAAAKRRGHAVKLGVRVPSSPVTATSLGLDAPAWTKENLVDLVVVAPRWATLEFAMPLKKWRELLGDRVTLAGGLEALCRPSPGAAPHIVTPEDATGAAIAVLSSGADVVYLFNYFQNGHPHWSIPEYQRMLKSFSSINKLRKLPRRHTVTFRDVTAPGENYRAPLPASGTKLSFFLPLGPAPVVGSQVKTTIEIAAQPLQETLPIVSLNGIAGKFDSKETLKNGNDLATHAFPITALSGKDHDTIAIKATGKSPVKVLQVEVSLHPQKTK